MPRKVARKEGGVFEKGPGSDIWWIRFNVAGRASGKGGAARRRNQALQDSQGGHSSRRKDACEHEGQGHEVLRTCPGSYRLVRQSRPQGCSEFQREDEIHLGGVRGPGR